MNKKRRERISRAVQMLEDAKSILEAAQDEEQDCHDKIPEPLQCTERYEAMEDAISNLETAVSCLDEAISSAESALA